MLNKKKTLKYLIISFILVSSLLSTGLIVSAFNDHMPSQNLKISEDFIYLENQLPVDGYLESGIDSYPGHSGIDIIAPKGTDIVAVWDGTVSKVVVNSTMGYGNHVVIDHGSYTKTLYAHMDNISIAVGDKISQGDKIGEVGMTGNTDKPHLHFEIIINGEIKNPEEYISFRYS